MFRGETFAQAGLRKIRAETGIDLGNQIQNITSSTNNSNSKGNNKLVIKSLIHVWNTFFPDSNWDSNRQSGYEGTQTVNAVVFCEFNGNDNDNDIGTNEKSKEKWAVHDHRWITVDDALTVGKYDKYVRLNVAIARQKGLL